MCIRDRSAYARRQGFGESLVNGGVTERGFEGAVLVGLKGFNSRIGYPLCPGGVVVSATQRLLER